MLQVADTNILKPLNINTEGQTLQRKLLTLPPSTNAFVKPVKQDMIKNPRMMPGTKIMILLLVGWSGKGQAIETTTGILGKHLGRCRRQIFRYLHDAQEEGYLFYSRTKDRIGRYTGIKIILNSVAIRSVFERKKTRKSARNIDVTLKSETNNKYINKQSKNRLNEKDEDFQAKLLAICQRNNISL